MRTDSPGSPNHMHWHEGGTCHGTPTLDECVAECVRHGWTGKILERTDAYEGGQEVKCYCLITSSFDHWGRHGVWVGDVRPTFHPSKPPEKATGLSFWVVVREVREPDAGGYTWARHRIVCVCLESATASAIAQRANDAWAEYRRVIELGWGWLITHNVGKLMAREQYFDQVERVRALSPDPDLKNLTDRMSVVYSVARASDDPSVQFAVDEK